MFVDELTIEAKAGDGGDGVVRWDRAKFRPKGGPAGGNGGKGGDVYMRAVRDLNKLSKYTGAKRFDAKSGEDGRAASQHGHAGEDIYIDVPVGSIVTDQSRERVYEFFSEGETTLILRGGNGGYGNEYFKSATNRSPQESTPGQPGESGTFLIELSLVVDVGLIGLPNAGKSTLLNTLTNAKSAIGAYQFTTLEPHLGALYGFTLADIPGLIKGAAKGKGLGHKFLRHVRRTRMLVHCISLENENVAHAYETVRSELGSFDHVLLEKPEWVVLTKSDLADESHIEDSVKRMEAFSVPVSILSAETAVGVKEFQDQLLQKLEKSSSPEEGNEA